MPAMPNIPARMRSSLNRFNCLSVLWTALHLVEEDQRILISVAQEPEQTMRWFKEALLLPAWANAPQFQPPEGFLRDRFDEARARSRSEEHTSELQSLMRISYAVFCLKKKKQTHTSNYIHTNTNK